MAKMRVVKSLGDTEEAAAVVQECLATGGCFVAGDFECANGELAELELRFLTDCACTADVRIVWVGSGDNAGVGVAFLDFDAALKARLNTFVQQTAEAGRVADATASPVPEATSEPGTDVSEPTPSSGRAESKGAAGRSARPALSRHDKLRRLPPAEQRAYARSGDVATRVALERIYGKAVWEALLANSRLTHPEVARIARMASLPKPQLELIAANFAWLSSGQVRRALLSNHRLSPAMVTKVLRATPKHELKLMPKQSAYPAQVRDAARQLLGR